MTIIISKAVRFLGVERMASALARLFGTGKGKDDQPSPQVAIQKLRETEEMLGKKSEFLEKKIEKELAAAKQAGMKNKRGKKALHILKRLSIIMGYLTV